MYLGWKWVLLCLHSERLFWYLWRSLAVGVEKKFQVRMSRAGRSAVSNLAAFNLEIKMLRSFGYLITVESLLRFPMVKDSSFSLPYFLFFKKKIIIYVSKFSCFVFHLQFPWPLRATMRSPLRSPAQVEGTQGFLPQPGKDLERPYSTRLEARFPYHGSGAMTRSPSPLAWRPDFPGAPREAH